MRDAKELTVAGMVLTVQRVTIVGIIIATPSGLITRRLPALEQFGLAEKKKGHEI
jgi:hypothetical protein